MRPVPVEELVLRYLGAFGPATVADVQQWSGLTRLREVLDGLPLRTFRTGDDQTVYDLPDAPRPDETVPAPPRFLPEYDNLLLSHKDRSRVIADGRPVPLPPGNGATSGTFLVDGMWQGTWRVAGRSLSIEPFTRLPSADREALLAEAERLGAFLSPRRPATSYSRSPETKATVPRRPRRRPRLTRATALLLTLSARAESRWSPRRSPPPCSAASRPGTPVSRVR